MSKDPFQILADELTLIRHDMAKLQRTSLDKDEAQALHQIVAKAVKDMRAATAGTPQALQNALKADRDQIARDTSQAATQAAERVLGDIREQLSQERLKLSQAAGEARRAAWRSFGGFWAWAAALLATGAFLGLLAAYVTETGRALVKVSEMVSYGCEWSIVGGQLVEQEDGSSFCLFWIETPDQAQ